MDTDKYLYKRYGTNNTNTIYLIHRNENITKIRGVNL